MNYAFKMWLWQFTMLPVEPFVLTCIEFSDRNCSLILGKYLIALLWVHHIHLQFVTCLTALRIHNYSSCFKTVDFKVIICAYPRSTTLNLNESPSMLILSNIRTLNAFYSRDKGSIRECSFVQCVPRFPK